MGRFAILLLLLTACPKKDMEDELEPLGKAPAGGRSVTKVKEDHGGSSGSAGGLRDKLHKMGSDGSPTGTGSTDTPVPTPGSQKDAGVATSNAADAKKWGGNGSPPYYDDEGHLHGPGGPVFMGKGPLCNAERDHCMRPGIWFAVDNLVAGKMYRATPIFEFEKKWYSWRGKELPFAKRFKTKVATKETVVVGDPVVFFIEEDASKKFVDNEYDAFTSSRWVAGYVERWEGDKVRIKGCCSQTVDTIRVIVETQAGTPPP